MKTADAAADVQAVALFPVEQEVAVAVEVAQAPAPQEPEKAAEEMSVAVETPAGTEAGPAADAEAEDPSRRSTGGSRRRSLLCPRRRRTRLRRPRSL